MADNNSIEKLRTEVEHNCRFKKAFRGYDKTDVDQYIAELQKNNEQFRTDILEENRVLGEKNKELSRILQEKNAELSRVLEEKNEELENTVTTLNAQINELENKIKNREMAEKKVEESVVDKLKSTNEMLMTENRKKELIIKEMEEKISAMQENVENYSDLLKVLDKKLSQMLKEKVEECEDIIMAWEGQFDKTNQELRAKIK